MNYLGLTVECRHQLVRDDETTAASTRGSQVLPKVLHPDQDDGRVWADSAYRSQALEEELKVRRYRNRPLTAHQKPVNHLRSKVRVSNLCSAAWSTR